MVIKSVFFPDYALQGQKIPAHAMWEDDKFKIIRVEFPEGLDLESVYNAVKYMQKVALKIRQATSHNWEKILPLFTQLYHGDIGLNLQKTFTHLSKSKQTCALVAEQDEKLVGSVIGNYYIDLDWEGKTAKLQAIIVDEKHRNRRIGKKLFQHFLIQAKENNCRAISARVNRKNRKASNFYETLNFEEAKTNEDILEL